jgi:hypothetical protein
MCTFCVPVLRKELRSIMYVLSTRPPLTSSVDMKYALR